MTALAWVTALVVTYFAATVQGVVGLGFAMVSVPILALIDPSLAPVPQLLITLPLTVAMAWRERSHLSLRGVGWIVTGRVPGAVLGVALLAMATQAALELMIAGLVLVAVAIIASGVHVKRTPGTQFGAGLFSGASGLIASIGGPPLALLYTRDEGPIVRSNLAAVFTIGLSITIVARIVSGNMTWSDARVAAILFPALVAGYLTSLVLKDRWSQSAVRNGILILSLAGAAGLIGRVLLG
ncbi:MAG: sulfite exporter TauE/SafE family protein [Acidimicrobiia bacterium]